MDKTLIKLIRSVPAKALQPPYPTNSIFVPWAGRTLNLPVVPAVYAERRGGGWWLATGVCPFCGEHHQHGSNIDADWDAEDYTNPLLYASAPKHSHCRSVYGLYSLEIVAGLPAEARGGR